MYAEDDLLTISALQHLLFCERQCALIHVEQLWAENRLTVEGRHLHAKAHEAADERRGRVWIMRGVPLRSLALGLVGKADVIEFHPPEGPDEPSGSTPSGENAAETQGTAETVCGEVPVSVSAPVPVSGRGPPENLAPGRLFEHLRRAGAEGWRVTPVEYKRGRPKKDASDAVQLCAQAICLEEMLGVRIASGMLFYGRNRRRTGVALDDHLRGLVADSARRLHDLVASGRTPPARYESKCDACSLVEVCLPKSLSPARGAADFTRQQFARHLASAAPETRAFDDETVP